GRAQHRREGRQSGPSGAPIGAAAAVERRTRADRRPARVRSGQRETRRDPRVTRVLTFGHGTADADRIVELLHGAGVRQLVDVRTAPGSRRNPHVARSEMERWLPAAGIAYRWERRLGGWRKSSPDSPDSALRNDQFRGYAGHMRSPKFA